MTGSLTVLIGWSQEAPRLFSNHKARRSLGDRGNRQAGQTEGGGNCKVEHQEGRFPDDTGGAQKLRPDLRRAFTLRAAQTVRDLVDHVVYTDSEMRIALDTGTYIAATIKRAQREFSEPPIRRAEVWPGRFRPFLHRLPSDLFEDLSVAIANAKDEGALPWEGVCGAAEAGIVRSERHFDHV